MLLFGSNVCFSAQPMLMTNPACLRSGYGGLALTIEGPSKVDIQTEDMDDGTCGVSYCPMEPGTYIVSIRFAEEHVPGMVLFF